MSECLSWAPLPRSAFRVRHSHLPPRDAFFFHQPDSTLHHFYLVEFYTQLPTRTHHGMVCIGAKVHNDLVHLGGIGENCTTVMIQILMYFDI